VRSPFPVPAVFLRICGRRKSANVQEWLLPFVILVWFALALCSYRHVILDLMFQWQTNTSYSHGPIVVPIAVWLLWHRKSTFPAVSTCWIGGIGLLTAAHLLLCLGEYFYVPAVQRWTIPIWLSGMIGVLWGRRRLAWSLPGVCFLGFMIPIPFQLEMLANQMLQWASAWCSCFLLGLTSTFAVTDGYTLTMATGRVGITSDCSGLRMTVAIAALCYIITLLSNDGSSGVRRADTPQRRSFLNSFPAMTFHLSMMMLLVIPAAVIANAGRITGMAFVMNRYRVASWTAWAHDIGDWLVLPVAAGLFLTFRAWYGRAIQIWQEERANLQPGHGSVDTHVRWLVHITPILRVAAAPVVLAAVAIASIWNYDIQREEHAAQVMTTGRSHEAAADWENAADCYCELMSLQLSATEASYRHAYVSRQIAGTPADLEQVLLQLESLLNRAPGHVAAAQLQLDLAFELDHAASAIRGAERLYVTTRDDAASLRMCIEAMLRYPAESSALPTLSAVLLNELADKFGPESQWSNRLVIELAAFCCQHPDTVDSRLITAVGSAITKSAISVDSAHGHFQAWQFEREFSKGAATVELARISINEECPAYVAYEIHLASAREVWEGGDTDAAKRILKKAVTLNPADYRSYVLLSDIYETQQNWSQCAAARLRAWRLVGDRPLDLGIKLSEALIHTEQHSTMLPLLRTLSEGVKYSIPKPARALQLRLHFVWAQLDMRAARHEDALQKLKHCQIMANGLRDKSEADRLPANIEVLQAQCMVHLGRYSDAAELFEGRATKVGTPADQWTAAARAWREARNTSAATRCYHNAIASLGRYSEVWLEYVHLLKETSGTLEAAGEVDFRSRRAQHGVAPIDDTILAQAWEIVGQPDRAISHYRAAAENDAHSVAALAIVLARHGRANDAVELVTDDNWAVGASIRAHTAAMVGVNAEHLSQGVRETITRFVDEGVKSASDDITLMLAAAEWYTKCASTAGAIELLARVIKLQPGNVVAANNLAMLLADDERDFDQALKYIENVLQRVGPAPEFLDTKGWILVRMNRAQAALPWLTEAAERSSSIDPVAQLHLAAAYMAVGDQEHAEEHFDAARTGQIRTELLNNSEQRAWASLQQKFMPETLTQRDTRR
jgi:exosortase